MVHRDTDNNRLISLEEFLAWDAENAEASSDFAILDRDSDGALSRMVAALLFVCEEMS